ncbi:dihydroxyacetone kinase subunit DhaK [Pseudolysinimonas kribbensis]|uniref:Dihydroxyacetone kinase subunit DhaK n=1 Tax=Pseudolysinimonas kribbensis TaxID=433641 RepID=A0ABQ6K254_9MICO|nr:dihydroxyacetone kinase subunit DhaK [Pseudolysinimonas kribbensis]
MRKIINDPDAFTDETIEGIIAAHPGALRRAVAGGRALVRADAGRSGKVGIVTGGGSGHLPVFLGYVGLGLCDGVAVGNTFSSPSAEQIADATRAVDGGAGVLYLYGNYGGDIYNFDIAADLVAAEGITTETALAADDVASAPAASRATRRGVAGMIYAFKIAGAAAERGDDLAGVASIARRVGERTRTMGVGLSPTILPAAGEPTFHLDEGEMEVGIGIHGEPGVHRGRLETADQIADRLVGAVLDDLDAPAGSTVSVLVNGLGATPLEELYILYRRAARLIAERDLSIHAPSSATT